MIDLGVIEVEIIWNAMNGPASQERIYQDIQRLPEIVTAFHHITAATIDEQGKVGGLNLAVFEHIWPIREISNPEVIGVIPGPATTHFGVEDAKFKAGSSVLFQVAI
jgi:hypothetical protein